MRLSEFAEALGLSIHTAKRRLSFDRDYRRLATLEKSPGKHWWVVVRHPDVISFLRICECFGRIFKRRAGLEGGFPRLGGHDWREGWANSKMTFNYDIKGFMADLQAEMPDKDWGGFSSEEFCQTISYLRLIRACQDIQKRGRKLVAGAVADSLGVSVAALYRPPFGRKSLRGAIKRAEGNMMPEAIVSAETQAYQDGLSVMKPRKVLPRAEYFRQRRIEAKHCYLAWNAWCETSQGLRTAQLRCYFEKPLDGTKATREQRRQWRKHQMLTAVEIAERISWQSFRGQISDGEIVGTISKTPGTSDYFEWRVGGHGGSILGFAAALRSVESIVNSSANAPRYFVLNPDVAGNFVIPWVVREHSTRKVHLVHPSPHFSLKN